MNICECLSVTATIFPNKTAIQFGELSIDYRELDQSSIRAAKSLQDAGVQAGDRVALMLPNTPSFATWYYGALRVGAVAVSISTRLSGSEVAFIVEDCEPVVMVVHQSTDPSIYSSLPEFVRKTISVSDWECLERKTAEPSTWHLAHPNDAALILYTSGTTGFPKGATLSHANVRSNVHAFNHLCDMQPSDRVLLAVPLFHCFGQNAILNSVLNVGGTIILQKKFDLNESKQLIGRFSITQLYGVPTMFGLLMDSCTSDELNTVRYCFSAAAPLPLQTSLAWKEKFGQPIFEGYGLTETSPFATYNHRINYQSGSIGMPIDSVEVRIVDTQTGQEANVGELGEIAIRGPNVMLGYWNRPDETSNAIRDGWFHSGDIGRQDENGYLFIVDRVKDMISVGGLKVFPAEVERVLMEHPTVADAAVVGRPDAIFGEQVLAFVVLQANANAESALLEIEAFAKQNLGNYKLPRQIKILDSLPRNPSGKVLKTVLREQLPSDLSNPESLSDDQPIHFQPPSLGDVLKRTHRSEMNRVATDFLQSLVKTITEDDDLPDEDMTFIDAGLDSLAMVQVSTQLQVEVGTRGDLPATLLFDYPVISQMANHLVEVLEPQSQPVDKDLKPQPDQDSRSADLKTQVEQMSEEEALNALLEELE